MAKTLPITSNYSDDGCMLNPLSMKNDQHQMSPCSINTQIKRECNENQGHDHQIEIATCMIFNKFSQLVP